MVKKPRLLTSLFLVATSISIAGCAARPIPVEVLPKGMSQPPKVAKVPLAIGVYYSPELRDHQHVMKPGLLLFAVRTGRASVTLFDQILPLTFERVVAVSSRPPLAVERINLVAVLAPSIESLDVKFIPTGVFGNIVLTAEITYRMSLYSSEGPVVASWTIKGSGRGQGQRAFFSDRPVEAELAALLAAISAAIHRAMYHAATKFMTGSRDRLEVGPWPGPCPQCTL